MLTRGNKASCGEFANKSSASEVIFSHFSNQSTFCRVFNPIYSTARPTITVLVPSCARAWILYGTRIPTARMRLELRGMGMGDFHVKFAVCFWAVANWALLMRSARRPWGATKLIATGRMDSNRSTALRVTTSTLGLGYCSARPSNILIFINVRARVTSRRKVAFF